MKSGLSIKEIQSMVEDYREEAISLLQKTVQIPSPTGQELAISEFFTQYMESFGLSVQRFEYDEGRPNLLAEWVGNEKGKKFIFNGHMDVFPPSPGVTYSHGAWSGSVVNNKLYGQGSADMKAGDCAAMMAVKILKDHGYQPDGKILLSYMVDEEDTSKQGVLSLLRNNLLCDGDFGICMEPSARMLLMEEGGVWQSEVTYLASGGHTTCPTSEEDALMKSVKAITRLYKLREEIEKRHSNTLGHPFLQINVIQAGSVSNVRAARSTFTIDRRFSPDEDFEDVKREIFDVLDELKAENPSYDYLFKEVAYYPSAKRNADDPNVKLMIQACEEIQGKKVLQFGRYASSDATHIMAHTGMQMPIYGPGDLNICSTADEHIDIDDYLSTIMIYIRTLDLVLGQKE